MRALCAVLLVAVATPAQAGVVIGPGVPFSAADLEDALAARVADAGPAVLEVQAITPVRMRVVGPGGRWEVELGDARGRLAARLVALHVAQRSAIDVEEPVAPRPAGARWRPRVTLLGGASRGVGADDLTSTVAGLELTAGGRWWGAAGFEWREAFRVDPADADPVDGRAWIARALVGRTVGRVELAVGGLVARLHVDSGGHARAWLPGLAATARAGLTIAPRWSLVVGAGADAYHHRVEVRRAGQTVATTPRVAVAATVGLRWELGR